MQSRNNDSTEKESRSVAHETAKRKAGPVAAYPAVSGVIQQAQQPIQLFKKGVIAEQPSLVSEDDNMAVLANGGEEFLAKDNVAIAVNVLNAGNKVNDYTSYTINTPYESDCGIYADNLMRRIASFNRKTEIAGKETVNVEGGPLKGANTETLFKETISSQPAPNIGQAYLVVNNPKDDEFGKKHFNFHWGTVIAQSGSDVITAESGSHTNKMKFDMYSQSKLSQSFQQRYYDAGKLDENAKTFQVNFTKKNK